MDIKKLDSKILNEVSGGAIWTAKCYKCGKDMTCDKGNLMAKIKNEGTWTSYVYSCPNCTEGDSEFKHLFEKDTVTNPDTGETEYKWHKVKI